MKQENRRVSASTSGRLSRLLTADTEYERQVGGLQAEGRRLQQEYGQRSEPVKAKALEIDAIEFKRKRLGVLVERLRARVKV